MATGRSLHIGLNDVDPAAYGGWDGKLTACEADADDMAAIAAARGFSGKQLLGSAATRDAVLKELERASADLKGDDFFLLTYSGHGGQVVDKNNDEDDFLDETWCLFDGQLIDDELYGCWSKFAPGTRILVLSDSCHSGSVVRMAPPDGAGPSVAVAMEVAVPTPPYVPRMLPRELVGRAYRARRKLYDGLQEAKPKTELDVRASLILISGCQDAQTSMDGPFNGAFTAALLRVWNEGTFEGSYRSFHRKIQQQLPITQQPNLMTLGDGKAFPTQQPFLIQ
jgi:metacaspase-1